MLSMNTSIKDQIIVVGSINTDMVVGAKKLPKPGETLIGHKFFMNPGGKGGNQAVAAARLGGEVSMVANLGVDVFGDSAIAKLTDEGIDCEGISRDNASPSGVAIINVDDEGENQIVVAPGANANLNTRLVSAALEQIAPSSIVLLQLEIPIVSVARVIEVCQQKRCRVMLDPAPAQALPRSVFEGTYLLTPNKNEAELLSKLSAVLPEKDIQRSLDTLIGTQKVRRIGPEIIQNNTSHTELPELTDNVKELLDKI